ncbi:hypothetical protein [Clostridium tertium]|uniref:hypothetical protein n=1 Tax=Clostridium tertium TaxID=1559 RepID=UPI0023B27F47|nr:hypothetical protein [Clostridium tertium]
MSIFENIFIEMFRSVDSTIFWVVIILIIIFARKTGKKGSGGPKNNNTTRNKSGRKNDPIRDSTYFKNMK